VGIDQRRVGADPRGAAEEAAERGLLQRPSFTIRLRIIAAFVLLFALMCGITTSAVMFASATRDKLLFLERAGNYLFEIEQARRFEKNFFLYGTSLPDALTSVHAAEIELERGASRIAPVLGERRLGEVRTGLDEYAGALTDLSTASESASQLPVAERHRLEARLRLAGARAVADAQELVDRERLEVHGTLRTSTLVAVGFLLGMSLLMVVIGVFLTHSLLAPLGRFVGYAGRIGHGDYTPIGPTRRYRDEFSNLALAINRMMRELKLRQEELLQAAKMAGVGTLTAGIAHELNNPINNISLTAEALIDGFEDYDEVEKLKMLHQIEAQVERASATVRNLLDFTRRERPVLTTVELNDLLRGVLRLVENELALGHVELRAELDGVLPQIRGNPRNLQQVFVNLILNAIQAMPGGGTLTIRSQVAEQGAIRIDVADTGVGIPKENLERIFEPFFTTKEPGEGTGLGLSVSYGIIEQHGGKITVTSEEGGGTTFSILFPIGTGPEPTGPAGATA
jgi:two-component system NtrC family sensor kinase